MSKKKAARRVRRVPMPEPYIGAGGTTLARCKLWTDKSRSVIVQHGIFSASAHAFALWMLSAAAWQADALKKGVR